MRTKKIKYDTFSEKINNLGILKVSEEYNTRPVNVLNACRLYRIPLPNYKNSMNIWTEYLTKKEQLMDKLELNDPNTIELKIDHKFPIGSSKLLLNKEAKLITDFIHPVLFNHIRQLEQYGLDVNTLYSNDKYGYYWEKQNAPAYAYEISKDSLGRFMKIMNTIFFYVELSGYKICREDLSIIIDDSKYFIAISEGKKQVPYDLKRHPHTFPINNRKYDYVFNGKFKINFKDKSELRDEEKGKLEDRINEILFRVFKDLQDIHVSYLRRHKLEAECKGEQFMKMLVEESKNHEKQLTENLIQQAKDHQIAVMIRQLIKDCKSNDEMWTEWAKEKANEIDPCSM